MRIADLGSAIKLQSADATTNFMIGTPGYLAPEVMTGKNFSFSADIWSIGALMHALVTAKLPFFSSSRKELKRRVCTEPLDLETDALLRHLSEPVKDLLNGLLRKDPSERLTAD